MSKHYLNNQAFLDREVEGGGGGREECARGDIEPE